MNIVADDCHLSGSIIFFLGGGRDLAEPDQQVLPTSSRVLAINFHINQESSQSAGFSLGHLHMGGFVPPPYGGGTKC